MSEPTNTISPSTTDSGATAPTAHAPAAEGAGELVEELLVEEISIDGMCGVY